ncbi:ABC transporter ATP-binding protein [Dactylosporangium siamense]|uniref:ABC transporter ATP-binding protein n=1 Tax=Dactylosporangium siamense TaxID=685454 RepID=A0A919PS07_9ACTN|nr:ABC transporter ATP-binding protein [Dactylosporangium siamense]GIG49094.1 ABC transporter ATP-binding protein [Dactylosporangium siamense]
MTPVLEAEGLGRRYGRQWALRDCTLALPGGQVIGLVGPNGAGKTTLLSLAVGLLRPTEGEVRVLGRRPRSPGTVAEVGFVAQDKPLYRNLTVAETLRMGAWLNPGWDAPGARDRITRIGLPMDQKVGKLSGGQRSQLALTVALSKRPKLLLLDEPVADLDPIARRDFLRTLMSEVAESGVTVVLSSHLLADVEKTCEFLVLLATSHVQLADDTETLLSQHRMVTGPRADAQSLFSAHTVVQADYAERQATLLVRGRAPINDPMWTVRPVSLEELALAYMSTSLPQEVAA